MQKIKLVLFLVLFISYGFFIHIWGGWNVNSRIDLTFAITDLHTFSIDAFHENTEDKAFYNGHYYTDKAPGLSFLGVPVHFLISRSFIFSKLEPLTFDKFSPYYIYLIRLICVSIPSALLGVIFYGFVGYFTNDRKTQLMVALGYSLATLAFPYSTLYVGHQISAALAFFSFFIVFKIAQDKIKPKIGALLLSGFLMGYAFISEYPVLLILVAVFIYLAIVMKQKKEISKIFYFIFGNIPPIILLMAYNYAVFKNPLKLGYSYEQSSEFIGMKEGFIGLTYPKFVAFYQSTFGPYRGLFHTSPFLLLAIPGFYFMYKSKKYRKEFYLFLFLVLSFLMFNSSYYMWYGGSAMGPRHIIPILPYMTLPIVFFIAYASSNKQLMSVIKVVLLLSIAFMSIGALVDPQGFPEWYPASPLGPFFFPRFLFGWRNLNWGSVLTDRLNPLSNVPWNFSMLSFFVILYLGISILVRLTEKIDLKNKLEI